jgi:methionyl-tRNA formyltransferase
MKILFLGVNNVGYQCYKWLMSQNENVVELVKDKISLNKFNGLKPDIVVSIGYRHLLSSECLKVPEFGVINSHKSLLPLNRGTDSCFWTIRDQTRAGVTMHYIDEGVDTGDIISQVEVDYPFSDTAEGLYRKLETAQFELFKTTWPQIKSGNINRKKQETKGTYHGKIDFTNQLNIELEQKYKAEDLINLLRAATFHPFKNAFFVKNNKKYYVDIKITPEDKVLKSVTDESGFIKPRSG